MNEIALQQTHQIQVINFDEYAMTSAVLKRQVNLIQEVMRDVMKENEHYGKIPGCGDKPTLLKPGAEKLSTTFRLAPSYEIKKTDLSNGHREYEVVCTLSHISSGLVVGQGVGSCSTMEGKYRFRAGEVESTGKSVPKEYWQDRDQKLIGGKGFQVKKIDGKWKIVRAGEKVEHDNPADYYNTVLKMAKKRAHVDAVLTATAASDIFTQDIEDMTEVIDPCQTQNRAKSPTRNDHDKANATASEKQKDPVQDESGSEKNTEPMTKAQRGKIWALMKEKELSDTEAKKFYEFVLDNQEATKEWASDFIKNFENYFDLFTQPTELFVDEIP